MTPVSVTPAGRVLSVPPTPSMACSTVTVHLDMWAAPATSTETNAALVRKRRVQTTHNMCIPARLFGFQVRLCPLHRQVPTLASTGVSVWTPMAPSHVTVSGVMPGRAVNKMSTSVLPTPARTMARVWIASGTIPASACLVHFLRNYVLFYILTSFVRLSILNELRRSAAFESKGQP